MTENNNRAFEILMNLKEKGIQVNYHAPSHSLSLMTQRLTREEIQEIVKYKDDIIILLTDDPDKFRVQHKKGGAGTELKRLLKKFGIHSKATCSCNKRAFEMDFKGIQWCEDNIDEIVGWLKEEAEKRRLPFVKTAGKILVKRAIKNAKKKGS